MREAPERRDAGGAEDRGEDFVAGLAAAEWPFRKARPAEDAGFCKPCDRLAPFARWLPFAWKRPAWFEAFPALAPFRPGALLVRPFSCGLFLQWEGLARREAEDASRRGKRSFAVFDGCVRL